MMKKNALSRRICALVLGMWLIFLSLMTWAVARHFQDQIYDLSLFMVGGQARAHYSTEYTEDTPGYDSFQQIMHLGDPYAWLRAKPLLPVVLGQLPSGGYSTDDWFYGDWDLLYGFQAAMVYYDEAGNPLVKSGSLLSLSYIPEESWNAGTPEPYGLAYIDIDQLPDGQEFLKGLIWTAPRPAAPGSLFSWVIRSTGYFRGDEFIPVSLDATLDLGGHQHSLDWLCKADSRGNVQWETKLAQEAPPDAELVTIYAQELGGITYDHKPVTWEGMEYASLVDLALDEDAWPHSKSLIRNTFSLMGNATEDTGAATFRMTVQTRPLRYALWRMIPFYFWGTSLVGLCLWLLLRNIRENLTRPLDHLSKSIRSGVPVHPSSRWPEVRETEEHLQQAQSQVRSLQNDNQQLRSSLDYAKDAEDNRRQLVSNITHELKTPLAVIHSYAEGLQAGIAAEKRDYYLRTILEESERMDAMVLEMLDLSRLEAGKVRLSTDHFSLFSLTQEILNRLAPEESRIHTILFGMCNDCMVTADEGRITQVVTNLISNALRYTPKDGCIWLRVFSDRESAYFQIENTAAHLPEEALEKIFDTFYRADSARSKKGTGLGLPIARNIIQLHRGKLTARNTAINGKTCLEFAFQIPLT